MSREKECGGGMLAAIPTLEGGGWPIQTSVAPRFVVFEAWARCCRGLEFLRSDATRMSGVLKSPAAISRNAQPSKTAKSGAANIMSAQAKSQRWANSRSHFAKDARDRHSVLLDKLIGGEHNSCGPVATSHSPPVACPDSSSKLPLTQRQLLKHACITRRYE